MSGRAAGWVALVWAIGAGVSPVQAPAAGSAPAELPADPLNSPAWSVMRGRYLAGRPVIFDERVRVLAPAAAENPLEVPVTVEAPGLEGVEEILVIADLNPIQKILRLRPTHALPGLSFRFKVEQSTPIRAAMLLPDGAWHVGGVWLSAAGGGCTTPSGASRGLFQGQVGGMQGRLWAHEDGERLRLRVMHPMDTGLASGIPAFYMDHLVVRDLGGAELATLDTFEPVAENPVVSLDLRHRGGVHIDGHDIQGNRFAADVSP